MRKYNQKEWATFEQERKLGEVRVGKKRQGTW